MDHDEFVWWQKGESLGKANGIPRPLTTAEQVRSDCALQIPTTGEDGRRILRCCLVAGNHGPAKGGSLPGTNPCCRVLIPVGAS